MIGIYKQNIRHIPCLFVVDEKREKDPLPLVIYFHGFTSAKEHNLDTAYLLAEKGFRVVLPDSLHHGEREKGISAEDRMLSFWDIVMENVKELELMKHTLDEKGLILSGNIAVAGTSMGGITTAAALTKYSWIKGAAIMMGTPKLTAYFRFLIDHVQKTRKIPLTEKEIAAAEEKIQQYDLSQKMDNLYGRPLFLWHGEQDTTIPIHFTEPFVEDAKGFYENKDRIQWIKEREQGHKVSRKAKLALADWLGNYSDANHFKIG